MSPPKDFLLFFLTLTSSASSSTKFMYSSKPCRAHKFTFIHLELQKMLEIQGDLSILTKVQHLEMALNMVQLWPFCHFQLA